MSFCRLIQECNRWLKVKKWDVKKVENSVGTYCLNTQKLSLVGDQVWENSDS